MLKDLTAALQDMRMIDLGQYLEDHMPVHPAHSRFFKTVWHSPAFGDICTDYQLIMNEHNGTHVDSFQHYIDDPSYEWIDEIPLETFQGPCVCIDATYLKACETLPAQAIVDFEKEYGEIQKGEIVLVDTGWMRYWAIRPNDAAVTHNYPGLSKEAAQYLADRGVRLVGIDTLGIDCWGADCDPAHQELLSRRIPIVENLCNLDQLHGKRGYFMMLPLKIRKGSASPVRPVAFVDAD